MLKLVKILCLISVFGATVAENQIRPAIINGVEAPAHSSYVYITYFNEISAGFFGGGSLITDRHILTRANIIYGFIRWTAGVGSNFRTGFIQLDVADGMAHPNYNNISQVNDIGILRLNNSVEFTVNIQPIALPDLNQNLPYENEQGRTYGFGFTSGTGLLPNVLQTTYQRVVSHQRCNESFIVEEASHFCAFDNSHGSNICLGDLGGPFIVQYRGVDLLVGISSMVNGGCSIVDPAAAYARVSQYRSWISSITGV